ncbi:MAG: STAS domain-containing protein [Candidatus Eiseniibacteriota bacterium]
MKVSRSEKNGVMVLAMTGKLMGGKDAETFHETVKRELADGHQKILIDLSGVDWINSTGLGILISAAHTVKRDGGALKLCRISSRVESILMVTRLNMIFETYDNEAQALASF